MFLSFFLLWLAGLPSAAQPDRLQTELEDFVRPFRAQVGVAVVIDHEDTVAVNGQADYPMLSVFKFHQALAVLQRLHVKGLSLDHPVRIRRKKLRPDTYSPLRDRYPEGNVTLPVRELLRYTLQWSDNNACDILFSRFGSPRKVDRYLRSLGMRDFAIRYDEAAMHRDVGLCYANRTTPLDAVRLIECVRTRDFPWQENLDYVFELMETCETGRDRLAAPLAATGAVLGHKTGTGDRNGRGQLIAVNDVGYVWKLPNRHSYAIAVFVKDSEESPEATAAIIAGISERVYRYVAALPPMPM